MLPYTPMTPDVSMNCNRYVDTVYNNQAYFQRIGARYENTPVGNLVVLPTGRSFTEYINREPNSLLVYFYDPSVPEQVAIINDIWKPLLNNSVTKVVLVDVNKFPKIACKYGYARKFPFLVRLIRGKVLRFLNKPFTYKNVCQFVTSTVQWRFKGFFSNDT
jgi:hypothetical protein